jgi:hypothetical protein
VVAVGVIRSQEHLTRVVFVDGCALFGGDIRLLGQVNKNVTRVFLRVAIATPVLVLEEFYMRDNPLGAQPQAVTMLPRNVLEGDKLVGPTMSSAEGDPVMIRTAHGATLLPSLLPTR